VLARQRSAVALCAHAYRIDHPNTEDLTENINDNDDDDYDNNEIDDNNINRAREPCSPNSDNS
jgi:hypothetical protein